MSIIDLEEEEKKRHMNYPKLTLIQGGKKPPNSLDDYWLKDLEEHAVFIARQKKTDRWIGHEYHLKIKVGDAFMLRLVQWDPDKQKERIHIGWFVGPDFCKDWDCVEVLDDGKSYRTDHEERLEGDVGVHTDSEMDQDTRQETVSEQSRDEPLDLK